MFNAGEFRASGLKQFVTATDPESAQAMNEANYDMVGYFLHG
jgi:hypothetical protein